MIAGQVSQGKEIPTEGGRARVRTSIGARSRPRSAPGREGTVAARC